MFSISYFNTLKNRLSSSDDGNNYIERLREKLILPKEALERSTPPAEPKGYRQAVERGIPALGELGKAAVEFPGRPIEEK